MEKGQEPERQEGKKESEEQYSFLQEKIKDKPVNWKKIRYTALFTAGAGLIFGFCVCLGFYGLQPWAREHFTEDTKKVTISKETEEETEDNAVQEEEEKQPEPATLTIDNYRELNRALYDVAREASKSIVKISVKDAGEAWLENEKSSESAGLLMADNGRAVLILTKGSVLQGDQPTIRVTFPDDSVCEAKMVARDRNLDLAVVAVEKSALSDTVWTYAKYAELGNSNVVGRGDAVIALGSPFGSYGGIGYGILSTLKEQITLTDGSFKLLTSDICGTENSTGILVDLKGKVIGILRSTGDTDSSILLTAYPISEIREQMELLLNQTAVPYLGIIGTDIPDAVKEEKKIEKGIYVREVEPDSPAMQAGIQSGDVVIEIDGTEINTMTAYKNKLLSYKAGDRLRVKGKREGADGYVAVNYEAVIGSKE
ncbi:MAG TPA: serine protease [Lachnospiraceae bacterium]|nr:serine protease [Lachnospiraceae bacterium]